MEDIMSDTDNSYSKINYELPYSLPVLVSSMNIWVNKSNISLLYYHGMFSL